ncbi:MAG: hypothetical protein BKP49_09200 [Treponema sp. CETP13]|nr:MAG: hypothetical protein BKP49_09200 [Treponema sp. CETP13]
MTILVIQCRLDSTRLPQKATLTLGGKPIIAWTMDAMHCVPADKYILATDEDSYPILSLIAKEKGWECFAGPKEDVLERFCLIIKETDADILIRATGDNPFLFYDAAQASIENFVSKKCDYFTYTGLPHGSGVEVFNAHTLLDAAEKTDSAYDHEHVGPAIYLYPEDYSIIMEKAPKEWNFPNLRTTIDTREDYETARRFVHVISGTKKIQKTYTASKIIKTISIPTVTKNILLCPSVQKGHGTGHLRRCIKLAAKTGAFLYIPQSYNLQQCSSLIDDALKNNELDDWQIVHSFTERKYDFIWADMFSLSKAMAQKLWAIAPVIAIDEGSLNTSYCDFVVDIIPSLSMDRSSNIFNPAFIDLPQKKRKNFTTEIHKVLISVGGEDPAGLTSIAETAFKNVKAVDGTSLDLTVARDTIPNLSEKLSKYDLVVTHYGFTAFEAAAANCAVILLGTTPLHIQLAKKFGFACIMNGAINTQTISEMILHPNKLGCGKEMKKALMAQRSSLEDLMISVSNCRRRGCPFCSVKTKNLKTEPDKVIFRDENKTLRRCSHCGLIYISFNVTPSISYKEPYFFENYRRQYGKTYLEDFNSIKSAGVRRSAVIDALYWKKHKNNSKKNTVPAIFDIGCAYGPFLAASADIGWTPYGIDASEEAIEYINKELGYPVVQSFFPDFEPAESFGRTRFEAVTMWYVIEHFENLDSVLRKVSTLLIPNGIFAFSTPSGSGVSAQYNKENFYKNSPSDHYTIFEPAKVSALLKKYGFKVKKIVYTGHHPERFPGYTKEKEAHLRMKSKLMNLGDTFEVYCIKVSELGELV